MSDVTVSNSQIEGGFERLAPNRKGSAETTIPKIDGAPKNKIAYPKAKKRRHFSVLVLENDPGAVKTVKILKEVMDSNVKAILDKAYPSKPLLDVLNRDTVFEKHCIWETLYLGNTVFEKNVVPI